MIYDEEDLNGLSVDDVMLHLDVKDAISEQCPELSSGGLQFIMEKDLERGAVRVRIANPNTKIVADSADRVKKLEDALSAALECAAYVVFEDVDPGTMKRRES